MSREKKIYLYLTNNNTGNISDPSSIYETPMQNRLENHNGAQFTIDFEHVPERKEADK